MSDKADKDAAKSPPTPDDRMNPVDPGADAQKEGAEDQKESSYS